MINEKKSFEETKEMPQGTEQQLGNCIYCGQSVLLNTSGMADKEQLDKWATERCTCAEAVKMQNARRYKRSAEDNINILFNNDYNCVADILHFVMPYIEMGEVVKVTVDTGGGVKGSISITKKERIKVERNDSTKRSMET